MNSSTEDEFTVIDVSYWFDHDDRQPAVEKQELATSDLNEAFDSHFHFDRTCSKIWKHYLLSTVKQQRIYFHIRIKVLVNRN